MIQKKNFRITQVFGDTQFSNNGGRGDTITSLSFDKHGKHLALGDNSGRIIVFQEADSKESSGLFPEYGYLLEWQSHLRDFDYFKSTDIQARIADIEWLETSGSAKFMLVTNDKKIRLWKLSVKKTAVSENIQFKNKLTPSTLPLPRLRRGPSYIASSLKRTFANHHEFNIHSVSASSDGENFLSADELRINLWNAENSAVTFKIVDIKPDNIDDVSEVITKSKFHPIDGSQFMYATSKGLVHIGDLRTNAKITSNNLKFQDQPRGDSYGLCYIISSISDASFSPDGRYIIARDYLNIKIWDVCQPSRPMNTVKLYDCSLAKLYQLYEMESIYDKFSMDVSPCSKYVVSGGYANRFQVVDKRGKRRTLYQINSSKKSTANRLATDQSEMFPVTIHTYQTIMKAAWNPRADCLAVASANSLCFFHA